MTMNHDKDHSHLHDPYQLPTPRSSIESRVSDDKPFSITLNTIPARKSGCLIKPEHTLQTPHSRTPSLDIPAPLVKASLLGTRGGNSAVDNVRDFLQGQHTVTIQVCRGSTCLTRHIFMCWCRSFRALEVRNLMNYMISCRIAE